MRNYIGLIHKDADSDFGVSFPDFPGVLPQAPPWMTRAPWPRKRALFMSMV